MTAAADFLRLESRDAEKNLVACGDLDVGAHALVWLSHEIPRTSGNVGKTSAASLGRLLIDSCVHLEQSVLTLLRGQPRLAWASLRIAAEALKDLDAIDRDSSLHKPWMKVARCKEASDRDAALAAFRKARAGVTKSTVTSVCQACMDACSVLGSHPNATSWNTLGPVAESEGDHLLPARLSDPATLRFHMREILLHGFSMIAMISGFRRKHLTNDEASALQQKFNRGYSAFAQLFPDIEIEVYDE